METNQNEAVPQTDASSASTESTNETLTKADLDFKRDMFKWKEKAKQLEEEKKNWELEQQQKKGNLEGVINSLKDEIKKTKHQHAQDRLSFADTQINNSIKQEALSRGVKDVDVLMKLIDDNDKSIIELDESFNVNREDAKNVVDKSMERYGHLFKKQVNVTDATPSNKPLAQPSKGFDPNKASAQEIIDYIKQNKDKLQR
jgi:hypothetical protein